jgi:hypothetical protein
MRCRLSAGAAALAVAALTLFPPAGAVGQQPGAPAAPADVLKWDLARLNQEPFKLIKATPDAATVQVRFVVEFTRPPRTTELFDWNQAGGPVLFRFLDEDRVTLQTVKPRLDGELVPQKGARIRLVLQMPGGQVLARTRAVAAVD